jgi:hypothetical protein
MNGILNPMPQGILSDPRQAAMLQAGLGLLQASGPSRTPVGLGQAIGQAGMQGINAFHQTNQANQQQQMFQMKLAEVAREAEERKKKEAAMAALRADPRFAGMGPLLDVGQVGPAIDRAIPKPTAPKPPEQSALAKLLAEKAALPPGDPRHSTYDAAIKKNTTSQPLVNVDTRQETEFGKEVGKGMGEMYSGLLKADMNAPASIAKYQRLGSLLSNVSTGKFKGTTLELKAAAKSLGVDLNALGVADDVAPAQAARALSNQIALELRNPAGGAGMPGALSDKDREFLIQSIPGLENDPAAIPLMVDYRVKLEKRAQQVARKARDYRRKNGKFDERFFDELQDWSEKNQLFPESAVPPAAPKPAAPAGNLSPEEAAELEALRKRFGK